MSRRFAQAALFATSVAYLIACPYSKVEESFNIQATYDLFTYGLRPALASSGWTTELASGNVTTASTASSLPYDHLQYPGVVPRTFLGPLVLSGVCQTVRFLLSPLIDLALYPLLMQFLARFTLLLLILLQWFGVADALDQRTGNPTTGTYLLLITATQFHLPFYASRMLPNTFACIFTLRSCMHWLKSYSTDRMRREFESMAAAVDLVLATALFRCDCLLLLFTTGLVWLVTQQLTIVRALKYGVATGFVALLLSVPLDSVLWQRWTWPEGEVLFFNTVLNKSSDWGVSAWHWYWTSALPKALLGSVVLLPVAVIRLPEHWTLWEQRLRQTKTSATAGEVVTKTPWIDTMWLPFLIPALGFVILYSFLGHKEVRFLFPALPLFNIVAAAGLSRLHTSAFPVTGKGKVNHGALVSRFAHLGALFLLAVSTVASVGFVATSYWNYPGGDALLFLTRHVQSLNTNVPPVVVHIDVASAMSGVSLFGQAAAQAATPQVEWNFAKAGYEAEHSVSTVDWSLYTHLVTETNELARYPDSPFKIVAVARGSPRLDLRRLRISTSETIYVLERRDWL